jgi:crotonobetainyl-CoA:carnitine CoA-transferase CaiB-like acyl-CoA transferase
VLSRYRVIDLTDERGQLTGQILAELGADVILVEPPGGSRSRRLAPFAGDEADPERSLWFWSYNRGKRSVVLDLDSEEGREQLLGLVDGADVVVQSDTPGAMAARGFGYDDLAARNEGLVYVSISPFGSDGPKARWKGPDLVVAAASGHAALQGDEDRAPLRIPLDQGALHASAEGAVATLIALHERHRSGRGQHVDMSAQESLMQATQSMMMNGLYNAPLSNRSAGGLRLGPFHVHLRYPATDGHVSVTVLFGNALGPFSERLMDWLLEEGACEQADRDIDFINFVENVVTGKVPPTEYDRIQQLVADFTATKPKAELIAEAQRRRLLIVPIATVADVAEMEQYRVRDFWRTIHQPQLGRDIAYPGPFAHFGVKLDTPTPAPALGADTVAVLSEPPRARPAALPAEASDGTAQPLSDVKVLDFMWVMAGPAATRVLADYGAQIVRVESANRVETARTLQPFVDDVGGVENSGLFNNMNANKRGITLDLSKPESRGVVLDLVRWADIVTESFSPKAMRNWGLGYEELQQVKPDLIMASSCLFGQSGPLSSFAGYGTMGAAMSGFYDMTGWPDREPAGCFGAYTDYVSPRLLATALLAALDHRLATGEGQYIDLSQAEASINFLTPALLDYQVNERLAPRPGNDHPGMSPHAIYPAAGDDRWVAIACEDDAQWRVLAAEIGAPADLAELGLEARRERRDEIDRLITEWSRTRPPGEVQERLQGLGVAAHQVQNGDTCPEDPQLVHRKHFRQVAHDVHGTVWVEGTRFQLSRTPADIRTGGPTYGQHTFEVLEQILGYDGDRIAELAVAGVLE